ncbi:MAG: hypothetical protein CM15mP62_29990 [Rhodospirillaceae bacterium]|nr:MAG: hypothetical protein CM15mP62_29990 [Rhodospirillaceae bacterium]
MASPVDQFKLKTLVPFEVGGVDLAYTTSSLWMTITVVAVTLFLTLSMRGGKGLFLVVGNRFGPKCLMSS